MNCPQCGSALPEGANLCPECGAPAAEARFDRAPQSLTDDISVILAEANLLRMRRQYDPATAKCVEVLRRYPNNAPAHSLLGDIYRDRGEYLDALGWYELAVQLDPLNAADRQKIQEIQAAAQSAAAPPAGVVPAWRRMLGLGQARLPFGLILGLMLGCVLLGALIALSVGRGENRASLLPSVEVPRVLDPGAAPPGRAQVPTVRESVPSRPQPEVPDQDRPPDTYRPGAEPAVPPAPTVNPADRESALLTALRTAAQSEGLMARVDSVAIDPRDDGATIAITAQDAIASPDSRDIVIVKSLRIADLALAYDAALSRIRVRCSAPEPDQAGVQREKVVFIGDVSPSALKQAAGRSLSIDEAMGLFTSAPWWDPQMRPSP